MLMVRRLVVALLLVALVLGLAGAVTGCKKKAEEPTLTPLVSPPVIGTAGVLRAGIDLSYPPFGGVDDGVQAGIDVDVAAAVAERLGLKLEIVDLKPNEIPVAINEGTIDVGFGAISIPDAVVADVSTAGSYVVDGPAIFSLEASGAAETTLTASDIVGKRVGVQKESPSFWTLESDYGEGFAMSFATVREAFDALKGGELDLVIGDAAVGSYIARDYEGIRLAGQFEPAKPLGVLVEKDAIDLETQVRTVLDTLASEGVLDAIRTKWLGNMPELEVATE
jgi:polar amino acid transport system substrate-binding protein